MQRYVLQHLHLYTLIRSNFATVLSEDDFAQLDQDWDSRMEVLVQSGMLPRVDLQGLLNTPECDTVEVAAGLIEELKIPELMKIAPTLRDMRGRLSDAISEKYRKP
jgi:hypothetical protein